VKLDSNLADLVATTPRPVQILNCRLSEDMLDDKLELKPGDYSTNVGHRLSAACRGYAEAVSCYEKENMSV
jgi:hypothetical protein